MSLERPEWLDDRFLFTCLQNGSVHESFNVKEVNITSVVPPGNNFGGCLWRVHVKYQENGLENAQSLSLVVKKPTEIESMKEAYGQFTMVEPTFYKSFMPQAYKISPNINFAPKTYVSTVSDVIILEDLKACGYLMADRCRMLDFDHCRLYVVAAATFHAVSVAIHKIQPLLVESLGVEKTFSNDPGPAVLIKRYNLIGMRILADKMELLEEYKRYSNILRNSASGVWNLAVEALKPNASLNALHQGDPWTPNMMFKYDSLEKVIDIKLLDFQQLRYSSPVNDLVFFLWTSAIHDVRESKLEDLYQIYCETLNEKLEEFGCTERLTCGQLLENVKILSPFALLMCAVFYPVLTSERLLNPNALMSEDDSVVRNEFEAYYDKEFCEYILPRVLRQIKAAGIFDYVIGKIQAQC
uniref:CHK kinase-like domain-containing protein n=1 Tax=Cuerna arida TaxID=1464854 RepID=A0A1B6GWD2_9HEMI